MAAILQLTGCGNNAPSRQAAGRSRPAPATAATGAPATAATGAAPARSTPTSSSSNVELPATFTLKLGGTVMPGTISGPASVPVVVTVVSEDLAAHLVLVKTPSKPRALRVPAGGRASVRLGAPPRGSYPIVVDGTVRARLVIGVAPGP